MRISDWSSDVCSSDLGLVGSGDYVARTFASWPEPTDPKQKALPSFLREDRGTLQRKPAYDRFSAYFNLDNGSGKIRGVYAQENLAAMPIFEAWMKPFRSEEHTSELQSLMRISYAVFCLKKKTIITIT